MAHFYITKFSSLNFDNDWKQEFEKDSCYTQKFAIGDMIRFQCMTDEEGAVSFPPIILTHMETGEETPITTITTYEYDEDYSIFDVNLTNYIEEAGTYCVSLMDEQTETVITQSYFKAYEDNDRELENTIRIRYTNESNDYHSVFSEEVDDPNVKRIFDIPDDCFIVRLIRDVGGYGSASPYIESISGYEDTDSPSKMAYYLNDNTNYTFYNCKLVNVGAYIHFMPNELQDIKWREGYFFLVKPTLINNQTTITIVDNINFSGNETASIEIYQVGNNLPTVRLYNRNGYTTVAPPTQQEIDAWNNRERLYQNLYFDFRVEGGFIKGEEVYRNESNYFRNQSYQLNQLSGSGYTIKKLTVGTRTGVPGWVGEKLNYIFSLTDVLIDDIKYTRSEGSEMETNQISSLYPLYVYRLDMEKCGNELIALNYKTPRISYLDFTFRNLKDTRPWTPIFILESSNNNFIKEPSYLKQISGIDLNTGLKFESLYQYNGGFYLSCYSNQYIQESFHLYQNESIHPSVNEDINIRLILKGEITNPNELFTSIYIGNMNYINDPNQQLRAVINKTGYFENVKVMNQLCREYTVN